MTATYNSFKYDFNGMMLGLVDQIPQNLNTKWDVVSLNFNASNTTVEEILQACIEDPLSAFELFINFYNNVHDTAFFIFCVLKGLITIENIREHLKAKAIMKGKFNINLLLGAVALSVWCTDQMPKKERPVLAFLRNQCPSLMDYFSKVEDSCFIDSEMHLDWLKRLRIEDLPTPWQQRIKLGMSGYRSLNALMHLYSRHLSLSEKEEIKPLHWLFEYSSFCFHNRYGMTPKAKTLYDRIKNALAFYLKKYNLEKIFITNKLISQAMKIDGAKEIFLESEIKEFLDEHQYMQVHALKPENKDYAKQKEFRLWDRDYSLNWGLEILDRKSQDEDDEEKKEEEERKKQEEENKKSQNGGKKSRSTSLLPVNPDNKLKLKTPKDAKEKIEREILNNSPENKENNIFKKSSKIFRSPVKITDSYLSSTQKRFEELNYIVTNFNSVKRDLSQSRFNNKEGANSTKSTKNEYHENDKKYTRSKNKIRNSNRAALKLSRETGGPYIPLSVSIGTDEDEMVGA